MKNKKNENTINDIECSGMSLKCFLECCVFGIFAIPMIFVLILQIIGAGLFQDLPSMIFFFVCSLKFVPMFFYDLLIFLNFNFLVKNQEIIYTNIWGESYNYNIDEIELVNIFHVRGTESIRIKIRNSKTIIIFKSMKNYELLKCFLVGLEL